MHLYKYDIHAMNLGVSDVDLKSDVSKFAYPS